MWRGDDIPGAGDAAGLTVYDKNAVIYKSVPTVLLGGGNVVIHPVK